MNQTIDIYFASNIITKCTQLIIFLYIAITSHGRQNLRTSCGVILVYNNIMMEQALTYLIVDGYSVIPVGKDKRPLLSSWKKYQEEIPTVEEVTLWFKQWPHANIGILTGKISGITVIDIDTYKPEHTDIDKFPETRTVRTGNGGFHLIYKYQEGLTISANAYKHLPGVDIRSEGGYIVGAGSVTSYEKDGKQVGGEYVVINNMEPQQFPIEMFKNEKKKKTLETTIGAPSGSRNDNLASFIGTLLSSHKETDWQTMVWDAVLIANETYKPPLPLAEVNATFNSIVNRERARRNEVSEDIEDENEKNVRQLFAKEKTRGTYELAKYMVKRFSIITIGEKEREMFVYRGGMYFCAENEIIFPEIQRILGHLVTKSAKMETYHKIADMTANSRDVFSSTPLNFIPLQNGVYDRITKELLPHDPKYKFTFQFPIIYDKDATCPKTEAFFEQILTPEQGETVSEWIGYFFLRSYMFKKAIIFVGEGDTGKTTLLQVIMNLIGEKNISGIPLQKMAGDKFAAAQMFEKHGNIVDELDPKDISGTGNFKIATGGGHISAEYKFGNQFSFMNYAKLTFACNKIPDVKDFDDEAYFNRWLIIRFGKTITTKIPDFHRTLTTDEERSGLFNLAMFALDRLINQKKFSNGKDAVDTKREMMRSGSSIAVFAADMLDPAPGAEITKEEMYRNYVEFCTEKTLPIETIKSLGSKLVFYTTYISEGQRRALSASGNATTEKVWRNVSVKESEIKDDDF